VSITVARRIEIERAIVKRLVSDALFFHGYSVSHNDGNVLTVERAREVALIMEQLHSSGEESLTFHDPDGHHVGAVRLLYGNGGYDVIADHSVNDQMTALVAGAEELAISLKAEALVMSASCTPTSGDEDTSECATLREARKRLRTCRELWPDNEPGWCEQCRKAQKWDALKAVKMTGSARNRKKKINIREAADREWLIDNGHKWVTVISWARKKAVS
jgi:hypothetical protein